MVWAVGALKQLDVLTDDDGNGRWIYLESFLKFLREHHRPTDVIKEIKKCNITKELKGHTGELKEINSQVAVAVAAKSILRYIFHHAEHLFICQKLVDQIEKKCHDNNTSVNTYDLSIKEIYKLVVKTEYRNLNIEKYILNTLSFQEYKNTIKIKHQLPCLKHLVICEEKYKFTPDDFKAATRAQRKVTTNYSISHLKTSEEVLSSDKFDKPSLVGTSEGKSLASTYLAKNVEDLCIKENITIDVDSELHITTCYCKDKPCKCSPFCTPVRAYFDARDGFTRKELLHDIKQSKGEAEMSQIDWLINCPTQLLQGESCASIVSSGDIDAVVLHLFTLSHLWPKNENESYKNTVYVILKKANHMFDIYNITAILEILEKKTLDKHIGIKVAIALSLGGNDFLPKFHSISHSTKLDTYMNIENINQLLIQITEENNKVACILFDTTVYKEYLKHIYCPKNYSPVSLTYQEVRQISIQLPSKKQKDGTRNPQLWLPPESVVERLARNVSCLIKYYLSAGNHSAQLPDFLTEGCLVKTSTGEIEYDFGDDAYVKDIHSVITIPQEDIMLKISGKKKTTKRKMLATPQTGRNRKIKPKASTPKKSTAESGTSVNNN